MPAAGFPETRPSLVRDVLTDDAATRARAEASIAATYWAPIHGYLCRRWRVDAEDARDLTQEFFAQAFVRGLFSDYDPAKARLRTWVRLCVDSHVRNAWKADTRLKRGGAMVFVDIDAPELQLPAAHDDHEAWFEREWLRSLFQEAVAALEAECHAQDKPVQMEVFRAYDLDESAARPAYADLAERFGIPVTQVTNFLHWARRRFRHHVLERLRAQCRTEEEFRAEARVVFGVEG